MPPDEGGQFDAYPSRSSSDDDALPFIDSKSITLNPSNDAKVEADLAKPKHSVVTVLPILISARRPYVPPPDHNIMSICRDTLQVMCSWQAQNDAETANRRRKHDLVSQRKCREQAAAWRLAGKERDEREYRQLVQEQKAQAVAQAEQEALEVQRKAKRKIRWRLVQLRLSENAREEMFKETHKAGFRKIRTGKISLAAVNSMTADERVDLMRKSAIHQKRAAKRATRMEGRKLYFDSLPSHRRSMIQLVFKAYDTDGSDALEAVELTNCLFEMGLRGQDPEERRAVARITAHSVEQAGEDCSVGIHELAAEIIPGICRQVNKMRTKVFRENLSMCVTSDGSNEDGRFDYEQVMDAVQELWPFDFHTAVQVREKEALQTSIREFVDEVIDLNCFMQRVYQIAEEVHWTNFAAQQEVKLKHNLSVDFFRRFRSEITNLDNIFKSVDLDNSGLLDYDECARLFKEIGLVPYGANDSQEVLTLLNAEIDPVLDAKGGVDFESFLSIITKGRELLDLKLHKKLKQIHAPWMAHEEASVTAAFLAQTLLKDMGIRARSKEEQQAVQKVIREADADGDDKYSLKEVTEICRKSQELLRQMQLQHEMRVADEIGFAEIELNQARYAFEQLDADLSGSLDKVETRKAASLLGKTFTNKTFATSFEILDTDRSGTLEFTEFLRFLHFLRDPKDYGHSEEADHNPAPTRPSLLKRFTQHFTSDAPK